MAYEVLPDWVCLSGFFCIVLLPSAWNGLPVSMARTTAHPSPHNSTTISSRKPLQVQLGKPLPLPNSTYHCLHIYLF